jgi:hypothetical protein
MAEFDHTKDPEFVDVDVRLGEDYPCRVRVPLGRALREWTDWDVAMFEVGRLLGVFGYDDTWDAFRTRVKGLIWSDNPMHNHLRAILFHLVGIGYLEYDKAESRFRCNSLFDWRTNDNG